MPRLGVGAGVGPAPSKGGGTLPFPPGAADSTVFWYEAPLGETSSGGIRRIASKYYGGAAGQPIIGQRPVKTSGVAVFDGVDDILIQEVPQGTAALLGSVTLPDGASGSVAGKGFTCTGLDRDADGSWWLGNHGLMTPETNPALQAPSVVHLSSDFATILGEYTIASLGGSALGSVQGVAYDSSDDTVWVMHQGDNSLYHISAATGAYIGKLSLGATAFNGLAYDSLGDSLIIMTGLGTMVWINKATGVAIKTIRVGSTGVANYDHLCFRASENAVYYSYGDSGPGLGRVGRLDVATKVSNAEWLLSESGAIEGVYYDGSTLWNASDEYYHASGALLNRVLSYSITAVAAPRAPASRFLVGGIMKMPAAPGATVCVLQIGDTQENTALGAGFGVYIPSGSSSVIRTFASKGPGAGNRSQVDYTVTTTTKFMFVIDIDFAAGTADGYINGVKIGATRSYPNIVGGALEAWRAALGAGIEASQPARFSAAAIDAALMVNYGSAFDRATIEGMMAWDTGNEALLPIGHQYKAARPAYA